MWEPKGSQNEGLGRSFPCRFGDMANMWKSMFYVDASSIEKVLEGPEIDDF